MRFEDLPDDVLRNVAEWLRRAPALGVLGLLALQGCCVRLRGLLSFSVEDVHNEASKALYVWRIADFWSHTRRAFLRRRQLLSAVFETPYGHEFRLRAFARRQGLAVYLEVPSTSQLPTGWHRKVAYTLTLHNQIGREDAVRWGQTVFTERCAVWGYPHFVSALGDEWILDDAVHISVHVRVLNPAPSFHAMTLALGLVHQRERAVRDASENMMRDVRRAGPWLRCGRCGAQLDVAATGVRCPANGCAVGDLATIHARLRDAMAQSCAGDPPFDDLAWPKPLVAFRPERFQRAVIVNEYVDLRLREARSRRRYEWHRFFDRCVP